MAYTSKQLTMAWTAVHNGIAPDAETQATLDAFTAPGTSDEAALGFILNSGDDTTALAALSYQFFTGKAPTKAGMDYLTNSATNPNDLSDPYYAKFNLENRYISFAANLGVQGEGAADFAAKYGAMSFADYVASIYETIIGSTYAKAAGVDVAAAIAYLVGTKDAVLILATDAGMITEGMTAAQVDLALKAAMAGLVMAASIKSDIGVYAASANNFMIDLAQDKAVYGADLVQDYGPASGKGSDGTGTTVNDAPSGDALPGAPPPVDTTPPAPRNFVLKAGVDRLTGDGRDNSFTATDLTFNTGDTLKGGRGTDTLTLNVGAVGGAYSAPAVSVSDIETAVVNAAERIDLDTTRWTGLTHLTVTAAGDNISSESWVTAAQTTDVDFTVSDAFTDDISLIGGHNVSLTITGADNGYNTIYVGNGDPGGAPTGTVTVTYDSAGTAAPRPAISVHGGTEVTVNQTASNTVSTNHTNAGVNVHGDAITTKVTTTAPRAVVGDSTHVGIIASYVAVYDFAENTTDKGSITTVSADGFDGFTYYGNALTTLYAAHGENGITIQNTATPDSALTLDLTLNGIDGGFIVDWGVYTTVNLITEAEASRMDMLGFAAATVVNISGQTQLRIDDTSSSTHLGTINVLSGGLVTDVANNTSLALVDASTSSADNEIVLDATRTGFKGGAGVDNVAITGAVTEHVDGGDGAADVLKMIGSEAVAASATPGLITGFEQLILTGGPSGTVDLDALGGIHHVTTGGGNGLTLLGLHDGDTLVLNDAGTGYALGDDHFGGADDTLNLTLIGHGETDFASSGVWAPGVENLVITLDDRASTPVGDAQMLQWLGDDLKTIAISGNGGPEVRIYSKNMTLVDARGVTLGDTTLFVGLTSDDPTFNHLTVYAPPQGNTLFGARALQDGITYVGGKGADVLLVSGLGAKTIDVGDDIAADDVALLSGDTLSAFTTIKNIGAGDQISFDMRYNDHTIVEVTLNTGAPDLEDYVAAASAGDGRGAALIRWFRFEDDTYIVCDISAGGFRNGFDFLVKLVGDVDMGAATADFASVYF